MDQLATAAKSVAALQEALEVLQPKLAAGAAAVAETTAKVEKEKEGVALVAAEVLVDQAAAEEQVRRQYFKSQGIYVCLHANSYSKSETRHCPFFSLLLFIVS